MFIGIGVLVDDPSIAVISPAIYNLYLIEDSTFTVMLFKAWEVAKSVKLLNVKVVFPVMVMLFLLLGP